MDMIVIPLLYIDFHNVSSLFILQLIGDNFHHIKLFNIKWVFGRSMAEQIHVETRNSNDDKYIYGAMYFELNGSSSRHTSIHFSIKILS